MEPVSLSCQKYVALENGTFLHSCRVGDISSHSLFASVGLGNPFLPLICSLSHHHDLWYFDVKCCQIHCLAADMFKRSWTLQISTFLWFSSDPDSQNIMFLCLTSMMWETLWPTFDQGHFLWTSCHYLGSWSRDSLPVPWSLHASMAGSSHSTQGFHHWTSIGWFCGCSTPAHCSHSVDCTSCTLRAIVIIGGSSHVC